MRALDTHALNLFFAVARCLNFRQAAEQLHMTQPPLSRAIRLLEERLGARLFERDTQGVALTQAGRTLLPQALHILELLELAQASLRHDSAPARLRLGLTSSVEVGLFRPLLAALDKQLGTMRLELTAAPSPRLVASVRKGQLDAALLALPSATFELAVQPLARQPVFFDHCQQVFRRHGFAPTFLREAVDHHVLLGDVAAGKGMALLADSFRALRLAGVAYRPLLEGEELAAGIGLAWREEHGHAALPLLRQLALEHLQK